MAVINEQNPPAVAGQVERRVSRKPIMRAWRIYIPSWQKDPMALIMATTRGKAIARANLSATDAGYAIKWGNFTATRAPEFDFAAEKYGAFSWDYDYALRMLTANAKLTGRGLEAKQ